MQPKPHPLDNFIYHPAFCHLARGAAIPAIVEASTRRDRREDPGVSRSQGAEDDESIARPGRHPIGQRLAALRVTLHLSLPRVNIRTAYAAIARKAVTLVTFAWRDQTPHARLDPALGALRNTGLFVRPHAAHWHEDEVGGGDSQLMPATIAITHSSHR